MNEEVEEIDIEPITTAKIKVSREMWQKAGIFIFTLLSCVAISFSFLAYQKLQGTDKDIDDLRSMQSQLTKLEKTNNALVKNSQEVNKKLGNIDALKAMQSQLTKLEKTNNALVKNSQEVNKKLGNIDALKAMRSKVNELQSAKDTLTKNSQTVNKRLNSIDALKSIQGQVNELQSVKDALMESNQLIDSKLENLEASQRSFVSSLKSLGNKEVKTDLDWTLAEIEYLMIIAAHRLALECDVNTALAAMQTAGSRLTSIADPRVLGIRRQVTSDINALKAVKVIDIPVHAMYLTDIAKHSEDLPLKSMQIADDVQRDSQLNSGASEISFWERISNGVWSELKDLIIISRSGGNNAISLLPAERYYLYQNLRLQIEMANLALLRQETEQLTSAITNILEWLNKYFDTSDDGINNILKTLKRMSAIELKPVLPDISSSLKMLRSVKHVQSESASASKNPTS